MEMKNKWVYYHAYDEYYDFHRSVQNFEDAGDTDIEVRLTFNTETHTAYYLIVLTNNDGNPIGWEKTHYIPWDDAINTIYRDGCDNFPEELKEVEIK
jgi:hypothetical protein